MAEQHDFLIHDGIFRDMADSLRKLRNEDRKYKLTEFPDLIKNTQFYEVARDGWGGLFVECPAGPGYSLAYGTPANITALFIGKDVENFDGIPVKESYSNPSVAWYAADNCQPIVGINITNMNNAFSLYGADTNHHGVPYDMNQIVFVGRPVCTDNVVDMNYAYTNCYHLTGSPACGNNVVEFSQTYQNCYNLNGSPVCGPKVVNAWETYANCYNLTGNPAMGDNVESSYKMYENCINLTGSPVVGKSVNYFDGTYEECTNLTGRASLPIHDGVISIQSAYMNCKNLTAPPDDWPVMQFNNDIFAICSGCENIRGTVEIPDYMNNCHYAFSYCNNLETIRFLGENTKIDNVIAIQSEFESISRQSPINILTPSKAQFDNIKSGKIKLTGFDKFEDYGMFDPKLSMNFVYDNGDYMYSRSIDVISAIYSPKTKVYVYLTN